MCLAVRFLRSNGFAVVLGGDGCVGVEGVSRERGVVMHKGDHNIWDAREQEFLKQNAKGESESMGC